MFWWLSFADSERPKGQQFLGAAVVEAPSHLDAVLKSHRLSINPGGEVECSNIPADKMAEFAPYVDRFIPPDVVIEKWAPERRQIE